MSKQSKTVTALLCGVAAAGTIAALSPVASAGPDGGVCARLNGVPFYIPPEGYMPKPGEVITGPVHAGPCPAGNSPAPNSPDPKPPKLPTPQAPNTPTSSPSTEPPPDPGP
jgi:hypothetical protein